MLGTLISAVDSSAAEMREWAVGQPWSERPLLMVETALGDQGMTLATVVLATFLLARGQLRASLVVVAVMVVTRELTSLAKQLFGRDRPAWQEHDALLQSGSFPSAHASTVAAFAGLLVALAIMSGLRPSARRLVAGAAAVLVLVVCADRLLLGRHYPTDLVGGVVLGGLVALLGAALLPGRRVVEQDGEQDDEQDDERDATPVGDAPLVERELVLSRSA